MSWLVTILTGVFKALLGLFKTPKTGDQVKVEANEQTLKEVAHAEAIRRDDTNKLDDSLLIDPDQRHHNHD